MGKSGFVSSRDSSPDMGTQVMENQPWEGQPYGSPGEPPNSLIHHPHNNVSVTARLLVSTGVPNGPVVAHTREEIGLPH